MKRMILFLALVSLPLVTIAGQSAIVPIVELKNKALMGGVQNGKWVAAPKVAPTMKPETEFVLVGWNGVEEGGVTLGKKNQDMSDICEDYTTVEFELEQDQGVAIGTNAKWNPAPRALKPIDAENAAYKTVVTNFLRKKGIARPVVKIKEAFRVDLEGDGVEEVVISATYYKGGLTPGATPGDYSFVILRKAVGKIVTDHMLTGEFHLRKIVFGAPNEHHISAIADLNGDGKMEVVVYGFYYEGQFASAFEMKNGRPVMIKEFEIGCGV